MYYHCKTFGEIRSTIIDTRHENLSLSIDVSPATILLYPCITFGKPQSVIIYARQNNFSSEIDVTPFSILLYLGKTSEESCHLLKLLFKQNTPGIIRKIAYLCISINCNYYNFFTRLCFYTFMRTSTKQ